MAKNSVPVDAAALMADVTAVIGIDPVVDANGEQRKTNTGEDNSRPSLPKWKLFLSCLEPGRKREMLEIGFAADSPPEIIPGVIPSFRGLRAMHWSMEGGRSGLAIQADEVFFTPEPANAKRNGAKEPVAA